MHGYLIVHGKLCGPNYSGCSMRPLAEQLEQHSLVDYASYPWAKERIYDEPIATSLEEFQQGIQRLRDRGATKVHIVGHSMGGNVGIYYATQYRNFDSLILLCPAHNTHIDRIRNMCEWSIEQARNALAQGNDEPMHFIDFNSGRSIVSCLRPSVYISYFSSDGLCNMTSNAKQLREPINVLLLAGEHDPTTPNVKSLVYDHINTTPNSYFEVMKGENHYTVCPKSHNKIVNWVEKLL